LVSWKNPVRSMRIAPARQARSVGEHSAASSTMNNATKNPTFIQTAAQKRRLAGIWWDDPMPPPTMPCRHHRRPLQEKPT
jgi:hypothetical protein